MKRILLTILTGLALSFALRAQEHTFSIHFDEWEPLSHAAGAGVWQMKQALDETMLDITIDITIGITVFWVICLVIYPFVVKWIKSNIEKNKPSRVGKLKKKDIIIKATFIPFISVLIGLILIMMSSITKEFPERLGLSLLGSGSALTIYGVITFFINNSKLWKILKEEETDNQK